MDIYSYKEHMDKQPNIYTKLGEIFTNLNGYDMAVEDMNLSVRSYNFLKRAGINNLREILSRSEYELIYTGKVPRACSEIIAKLDELSCTIVN